jgi:hypothetical protein
LISPPKVIYAELIFVKDTPHFFFQTYFRITLYIPLKKKTKGGKDLEQMNCKENLATINQNLNEFLKYMDEAWFHHFDKKKIGHEIPEIQLIVHYIIFFAIAQILCYHQVTFLRQ